MTPIGHLSVSYIAGRTIKPLHLWAVLMGGFLPDVDFLLLPFDFFNAIHRVVTHNIFFLLLCVVIAWFTVPNKIRGSVVAGLAAGMALHFLADSLMDNNPSNGLGLALFWPLSEQFFMTMSLIEPVEPGLDWRQPVKMITRSFGAAMLFELPLAAVAGILFFKCRSKR